MADSSTKRFLKPFMRRDKHNLTHTLLDGWMGGKVMLPEDRHQDFLIAYCTDVKNNVNLYVNELRRHNFRMFLDLDIHWHNLLTDKEVEELVAVITTNFKRFFPKANKDQFLCVVSDACPKSLCIDNESLDLFLREGNIDAYIDNNLSDVGSIPVDDFQNKTRIWDCNYDTVFKLSDGRLFKNTHRKDGLLKHGIHIIFPHIIVTQEEALYMRESLIEALTKEFTTKYAPKGFADVVDNAVYCTSGMRMLFSCKTEDCKHCKNKKDAESCTFCVKGKDLTQGRPYLLKFVCNDGHIDENITNMMRSNMIKLLNFSTIHTTQCKVSENWKLYDGCPSFGDIEVAKKNNGPPKLKSKERIFNEEKATTKTWKSKLQVTDTSIHAILLKHIHTRFVKQYKTLRIRSVVRDDKRYYISVDGEGSNYCLNFNPPRDHKSNRIWFSAEKDGISVRCFCTCPTTEERTSGLCKNFKTPPRNFSPSEQLKLFPKVSVSQNPLFAPTSTVLEDIHRQIYEGDVTLPDAKRLKK